MAIAEKIKILMLKKRTKQKDIAETLGTSPENFNNKLRRKSFSENELVKIAAALGVTYTRDEYFTLDTGERI